jgi:hypothetical protein
MTIEEQVLEKLRRLPPGMHGEVLHFVDLLSRQDPSANPRRSLRGLWKDLNIEIGESDIVEVRPVSKGLPEEGT